MNKCVIYNNIFNEPFSMPICPLRAYAEKNNIEIIQEFRPQIGIFNNLNNGFSKMISYLKNNNEINNIIFFSTGCLIISYQEYLNLMSLQNMNIHFVEQELILDDAHKDELLDIVSDNFIYNLSRRIAMNIEYYISQGQIPFRPPFGYKKIKNLI